MSIKLNDKENKIIRKLENVIDKPDTDEEKTIFFSTNPTIKNVYDTIEHIMMSEEYKSTAPMNKTMYLYKKLEEIQKFTPAERIVIEKMNHHLSKKYLDGNKRKKKYILVRKRYHKLNKYL